jgi:hypothetical protein
MTLDQIQSKLDVLRENLTQLDRVPQASLAEFRADFRNVSATLYLLQTSPPSAPSATRVVLAVFFRPAPALASRARSSASRSAPRLPE